MPKKVAKKSTRTSIDVDQLIVEVQRHTSLYDTEDDADDNERDE